MMRSIFLAASVGSTVAQSITSCNTADAHFKEMKITVSPDPPVLGENVTFTVEGTLDKQTSAGIANVNFKAGFIKEKLTIPFKNSPAIGKIGEKYTMTFGPFKYPNIKVPFIRTTSGKVEITDQDEEQLACIDFKLPAYSETVPASSFTDAPIVDCSDPSYHLKNVDIHVTPAAPKKGDHITVEIKADLDEDISAGNVQFNVDLGLFKLNVQSPFSITPSVSKTSGMDSVVGPILLPNIHLIPSAKGGVKVTEQNGEPLACINFDLPVFADEAVAV